MANPVPEDLQRLAKAIERLEQPGAHVVGTFAEDRRLRYVPPTDPGAVRWCAVGAMDKEGVSMSTQDAIGSYIVKQGLRKKGYPSGDRQYVMSLNDEPKVVVRPARWLGLVPEQKTTGREAVRKAMTDFLHEEMKKYVPNT